MSITELFNNKKLDTNLGSNHTKKPTTYTRGSFKYIKNPFDRVRWIEEEFELAVQFLDERLDNNSDAWKLYSGFNNGQWPQEVVNELKNDGRNIVQLNFIRGKVDGLAGAMLNKYFDVAYEPIDGKNSDVTRMLKELWLSDKELLDYKIEDKDAILDGLIFESIQEMYIETRYDPLGNIGFRRVMPGHVVLDPEWLSNNSWELSFLFKVSYLTAEEIKEKYKTKSDLIDAEIEARKLRSTDFDIGDQEEGYPYRQLNAKYGDKYRVIEYHHMEKKNRKIEVSIIDGKTIPEGSEGFRQEWARINNVDLENDIIEREYEVNEYFISTICPELLRTELLEDSKSPIQIGRLPFFIWSSGRINGVNSGIPELLKSIQQTINYRESLIDGIISSNAANAMIIDPELVDNDENAMQQLKENKNKVGFTMYSAPGRLASGRNYTQELRKTPVDFTVIQELNRMIDMTDRIGGQPAVSDARTQSADESGILFARKQLQADILLAVVFESFRHFINEKGEAYFLLAKQLYSGVYRSFNKFGQKDLVEINKPVMTPSGMEIENDISTLPRMKVIITESPESPTQRNIDRTINIELLRVLGETNPINRANAVKNIMKTLDVSKFNRQILEDDAELERMLAEESVKTQIMNMKYQQMQIQQQIAVPQQQIQQDNNSGNIPEGQGNPQQNIVGSSREMAAQASGG